MILDRGTRPVSISSAPSAHRRIRCSDNALGNARSDQGRPRGRFGREKSHVGDFPERSHGIKRLRNRLSASAPVPACVSSHPDKSLSHAWHRIPAHSKTENTWSYVPIPSLIICNTCVVVRTRHIRGKTRSISTSWACWS